MSDDEAANTGPTSTETGIGPSGPWVSTSPTASPPPRWELHWAGIQTVSTTLAALFFVGPEWLKALRRITESGQCNVWSTYIPLGITTVLLGVTVYQNAFGRLIAAAKAVIPLVRKP